MIRSIAIIEMAGRPAEHVKLTLEKHANAMKAFKDVKLNSVKVSEPKEVEGGKGIFTCFAEVDFETENLARLSDTVFDFMPSSIEIIEPAKISFSCTEASSLFNNITGRIYRYDQAARILNAKMEQMAVQLKNQNEQKIEEKPAEEKSEKPKKEKPIKAKAKKKK